MKAIIIGDTHFGGGFSLGRVDPRKRVNSRLIDCSNTFDYIIDFGVANEVKHIIITGDVFEHRRPGPAEMSLFAAKIKRLSDLGIYTHIVIGNHDLIYEQNTTSINVLKELKLPKLYIYSEISSVECSDGLGDSINFIFLPFKTRKMLKCSTNKEAVERIKDRLYYEVSGISNLNPKILVGHLMVQGTMLGNAIAENYLGEISLPLNTFKNLDGAVMGHVHPHQVVNRDPFVAYVGSMEKMSFADASHDKFFLYIRTKGNNVSFNFEKLNTRKLYDISINASDIKNGKEATDYVINYVNNFAKTNDIFGSIVRLQILLSRMAIYNFSSYDIRKFLKDVHNIHNCVGIYPQAVSNRQLRKSSITERADPKEAFIEYLSLEENEDIKKEMKELGLPIIKERFK